MSPVVTESATADDAIEDTSEALILPPIPEESEPSSAPPAITPASSPTEPFSSLQKPQYEVPEIIVTIPSSANESDKGTLETSSADTVDESEVPEPQ